MRALLVTLFALGALAALPACQNARLDRKGVSTNDRKEVKNQKKQEVRPQEELDSTPSQRRRIGPETNEAPVDPEVIVEDEEVQPPEVTQEEEAPYREPEILSREEHRESGQRPQKRIRPEDDDSVLITWLDPVEGKRVNVLDSCLPGQGKDPAECETTDVVEVTPPPTRTEPPKVKPVIEPPVARKPVPGKKFQEGEVRYTQPRPSKHVDILFVVDTSAELKKTRGQIAEQLPELVRIFKNDESYNIAMLPASAQQAGQLYAHGSDIPLVLQSSKMQSSTMKEIFTRNMTLVPADAESDGGQLGLYSLSEGLKKSSLADSASGFLTRSHQANSLLVIFVSHENDICYDYKNSSDKPRYNGKSEIKAQEKAAYDRYCEGVSPKNVVRALQTLRPDAPLIITGIVNTSNNKLSNISSSGEDEMGHGYIDVVRMSNFNQGLWPISNKDYAKALRSIGVIAKAAMRKVVIKKAFEMPNEDIVESSLRVFVDGVEVYTEGDKRNSTNSFTYNPRLKLVQLKEGGKPESSIVIRYQTRR